MKRNNAGKIFVAAGLLLIAAALCLTVYNIREQTQAFEASFDALRQLTDQMQQSPATTPDEPEPEFTVASEQETVPAATELDIPDYLREPHMEMPEKTVDGQDYIGVLEIPSLELSLPIISQWSYHRLRIAPCRYLGSAYTDDLVIMAHNYRIHFGNLLDLQIGDEVYFTDMDGNIFGYQVTELETLAPTAVEEMIDGDWDLTLFTCTLGGRTRVTVRCARMEN